MQVNNNPILAFIALIVHKLAKSKLTYFFLRVILVYFGWSSGVGTHLLETYDTAAMHFGDFIYGLTQSAPLIAEAITFSSALMEFITTDNDYSAWYTIVSDHIRAGDYCQKHAEYMSNLILQSETYDPSTIVTSSDDDDDWDIEEDEGEEEQEDTVDEAKAFADNNRIQKTILLAAGIGFCVFIIRAIFGGR